MGEPTWSRTTSTKSLSSARPSIVSTKLRPPTPNSHELRTMKCCGFTAAVSTSPASFEVP